MEVSLSHATNNIECLIGQDVIVIFSSSQSLATDYDVFWDADSKSDFKNISCEKKSADHFKILSVIKHSAFLRLTQSVDEGMLKS